MNTTIPKSWYKLVSVRLLSGNMYNKSLLMCGVRALVKVRKNGLTSVSFEM